MSAWLDHVKNTMKLHPGKALKDVLKIAKGTYKKGESVVEYAVTGKKARKTEKAKKSAKAKKSQKGGKKSRKTVKKARKTSRRRTGSRKH